MGSERKGDDFSTERELLYKILFDMRSDINDLKQMVAALHGGYTTYHSTMPKESNDVRALLPHAPAIEEYAESEVVEEDEPREMTKADMQREQIVRALRRNGGSRRAAAAELFMWERTLYRKIKELNIEE
jgi:DNA-binding NtrC family response regulator